MASSMTFGEIITAVKVFLNLSDEDIPLIKTEINLEYDRIATLRSWEELQVTVGDSTSTALTLTSGTSYLALPADAVAITAISDTSGGWALNNVSDRQIIEQNAAGLNNNGPIVWYKTLGLRATKAPLSVDDQIQILGNGTTDLSRDVTIQGLRSDVGIVDREVILTDSTNSTTAVDSANSYEKGWSLQSISCDGGLADYLIIREKTTAANILAYITEWERSPQYFVIAFENPPDTSDNLAISYKRKVVDMVEDQDRPMIPVESALVEGVRAKLRQRDKKYDQAQFHKFESLERVNAARSERVLQSTKRFQVTMDYQGQSFRRGYR